MVGNRLKKARKELVVDVVRRLPQGAVSRSWGWLARRQHPKPLVGLLKRAFVQANGIDMSDASQTSIDAYPSLQDLFIRTLRKGERAVDTHEDAVCSPVDGTVGACGEVTRGTLMQIKGRSYTLARLLGSEVDAEGFEGGAYATFYLAPHNYHRIHAPLAGAIQDALVIPGHLFPVFPTALEKVDELFCRNERVVTYIDTPTNGRIAVVKIGATLVGRIAVTYDPSIQTNCRKGATRRLHYSPPHAIGKGEELGAFELGSSVVVVAESGKLDLNELSPGMAIQVGQRIGTLHHSTQSSAQP